MKWLTPQLIVSIAILFVGFAGAYAAFSNEPNLMDFIFPYLFLLVLSVAFVVAIMATARRYMRDWQKELAGDFQKDALEKVRSEIRGYKNEVKDYKKALSKDLSTIKTQYHMVANAINALPERKGKPPLRLATTDERTEQTGQESGEGNTASHHLLATTHSGKDTVRVVRDDHPRGWHRIDRAKYDANPDAYRLYDENDEEL